MRNLAWLLLIVSASAGAAPPVSISAKPVIEREIGPSQSFDFTLRLRRGESAEVTVQQIGVDLVVDLLGPGGRLLDSVDSPNGRNGDEPVAIAAEGGGIYTLRIRPISAGEPPGRFSLRVVALRDRATTARIAAQARAARAEASRWLGTRSAALPADTLFDALVAQTRVVGLGEASHGSRELNDARLAMVRRLVERHGFRLIALEDSASRWRALADYVTGGAAGPPAGAALQWGWISRRARHELLLWVRQWNLAHRGDEVRIVGVDPQDSQAAQQRLTDFLAAAYGADFAAAWAPAAAELAAADAQTEVFGNSDVSADARTKLLELHARLEADEAMLVIRLGAAAVTDAKATVGELVQFADFNGGHGPMARSRDWYMAANLLAALGGDSVKAVYWGHNAHVSAAATRWGPAGALLRQTLGCAYTAIATTFGEGAFLAQVPGDPENRLAVSTLAGAAEESIEAVIAGSAPGARLAAWGCGESADIPAWLAEPRPLRWIGGLYASDTLPRLAYQPYRLTQAFDAIIYVPRVTAEEAPADRPRVPPRPRPK